MNVKFNKEQGKESSSIFSCGPFFNQREEGEEERKKDIFEESAKVQEKSEVVKNSKAQNKGRKYYCCFK